MRVYTIPEVVIGSCRTELSWGQCPTGPDVLACRFGVCVWNMVGTGRSDAVPSVSFSSHPPTASLFLLRVACFLCLSTQWRLWLRRRARRRTRRLFRTSFLTKAQLVGWAGQSSMTSYRKATIMTTRHRLSRLRVHTQDFLL